MKHYNDLIYTFVQRPISLSLPAAIEAIIDYSTPIDFDPYKIIFQGSNNGNKKKYVDLEFLLIWFFRKNQVYCWRYRNRVKLNQLQKRIKILQLKKQNNKLAITLKSLANDLKIFSQNFGSYSEENSSIKFQAQELQKEFLCLSKVIQSDEKIYKKCKIKLEKLQDQLQQIVEK